MKDMKIYVLILFIFGKNCVWLSKKL